jgi:hypothetical protein
MKIIIKYLGVIGIAGAKEHPLRVDPLQSSGLQITEHNHLPVQKLLYCAKLDEPTDDCAWPLRFAFNAII